MNAQKIAAAIYQKYLQHYDGEIQGCCPLIADEISRLTGAAIVAGYITFYGGALRRSHWWCDLNGETIDPMGDEMMSDPRDFSARGEVHRNQRIFEEILPNYEQWRIV